MKLFLLILENILKIVEMNQTYISDQTFDKTENLTKSEFDNCVFNACTFEDNSIAGFKFIACTFNNCNLSLSKLNQTVFQDVLFNECKMLGLRFDTCSDFGLSFSFENCQLNHSSFYKLPLKNTRFIECQLQEIDFSEADLSNSVFKNCDLLHSVFERTTLDKVDFRSAFNFSFDPEKNRMKKAKFSLHGVVGLLNKYDIVIEK